MQISGAPAGGNEDVAFLKGHGTQNDFVVLPDPDARLDLSPDIVAAICDRRAGLGGDGILRVARAGALLDAGVLTELPDGVDAAHWFMDYRNADGSIAEMCGNGVRVFAHYLISAGLMPYNGTVVGSRAGARPVVVHHHRGPEADISVSMGPVRRLGTSTAVIDGRVYDGLGIDVGNPHLACVVDGLDAAGLADLDLTHRPEVDDTFFPAGVNVEMITPPRDGAVAMRVFERGVGETRSCGTGVIATAAAALAFDGDREGTVAVRVPGGLLEARIDEDGSILRGPSVLLAAGTIDHRWWAAQKPHASTVAAVGS